MEDRNSKTLPFILGIALVVLLCIIASGIANNQQAKAVPSDLGRFQLWGYGGQVSTDEAELVEAPGDGRCIVIDRVNSAVVTAAASSGFKVTDGNGKAYWFIPTPATSSIPGYNVFMHLVLPEDSPVACSEVGSGGEIFLSLEGHYETVF
jgi:hypothetical protein